jgi:ElaB/YqjD/DUF883 family membrane-anchored ribosome-binding protein
MTMETYFHNIEDPTQVSREKVAEDLRALIRDAEELLKAGVGDASGKTAEIKARLQASVEQAKATAKQLEDKAIAGAKAADRVIRAHPYESMGIAFGFGLLFGMLVGRK